MFFFLILLKRFQGELTKNLTIMSKEEWLTAHYKDDVTEKDASNKMIGTTKNKREYENTIADEFLNMQPKVDQECYLYLIDINEDALNLTNPFEKFLNENIQLGFLSSKNFDSVLKLYYCILNFCIKFIFLNSFQSFNFINQITNSQW